SAPSRKQMPELSRRETGNLTEYWGSHRFHVSAAGSDTASGSGTCPAFLAKPVHFEAASQGHPGAMQHHPEIVLGNVQQRADLLGFDAIQLPQIEGRRNVLRQFVGTITERLPESFIVEALAGIRPLLRAGGVDPAVFTQAVRDKPLAFLVRVKLQVGEGG